ncbi:Class-I pyridoxal-phosphate-dependent aminotransferase-like protein [Pleurotus pulmonarius]
MHRNEDKPKAIDLSHHLSNVSKARKTSPLKGLQRYAGKEGVVQMAGGFPSPAYFPFSELSAEGLIPDSFPLSPTSSSTSAFSWLLKFFQGSKISEKTTHLTIPKYPAGPNDLNLAASLQYGMAKGAPQLQKILDELVYKVYKPAYKDSVILVHAGNTDAWFKCVQTFCNPGDGVLVSEWTYPSAVATMVPYNIKPVAVPMDGLGMSSVGLRKILEKWDESTSGMPRPRVMYIVPIGQNPTGATMGIDRKQEIYDICVEFDVLIVEDDPYYFLQEAPYVPRSERSATVRFNNDEAYLSSLVPSFLSIDYQGRVIRLDSFSKTIAPGCRLGWFTCNSTFAERFERQGETTTQAPCGFGQSIVTALLLNWGYDGYIRWLRALTSQYQLRRDFILDCLGDEFHLKLDYETSGVWSGCDIYRAYDKAPADVAFNEKLGAIKPMFSLVPPTSGMYIWLQLHLENHPSFGSVGDGETLEMQLWIDLAEAGVLFAPGWMFSAKEENTDAPGEGHFRISFSNADFEVMKKAITTFGVVIRKFFEKQ